MPIPRTLNQNFFKTWTPEMAYVLGYFAADGCMILNNRDAFYIEFTSTDRILLEQLQKVTGSQHKIKHRESESRRNLKWKPSYRIQIGSKEWFEDLTGLGFTPKKSLTLQFPDVPSEFLGDFVRGYFDGDGCVYFKEHFAKDRNKNRWFFTSLFTCGSKEFLQELWRRLLLESDINGGHISPKSKGGHELVFSRRDSLALYRLMYHTSEVTDLFLPRKREKFEEAIKVLKLT